MDEIVRTYHEIPTDCGMRTYARGTMLFWVMHIDGDIADMVDWAVERPALLVDLLRRVRDMLEPYHPLDPCHRAVDLYYSPLEAI